MGLKPLSGDLSKFVERWHRILRTMLGAGEGTDAVREQDRRLHLTPFRQEGGKRAVEGVTRRGGIDGSNF